jgi:hypothetical protein
MKHTRFSSATGEGEAMVLLPIFCPESDILFFQSTSPVSRLTQIAKSPFAPDSVELTNTRSPATTGVAPLSPGIGMDQATFSVWVHLSGKLVSTLDPLKNGPRHCGQSPAQAGPASVSNSQHINKECRMMNEE